MSKEIKKELDSLKKLLVQAKNEWRNFDYAIHIRDGKIKRTIISEVYNGSELE